MIHEIPRAVNFRPRSCLPSAASCPPPHIARCDYAQRWELLSDEEIELMIATSPGPVDVPRGVSRNLRVRFSRIRRRLLLFGMSSSEWKARQRRREEIRKQFAKLFPRSDHRRRSKDAS